MSTNADEAATLVGNDDDDKGGEPVPRTRMCSDLPWAAIWRNPPFLAIVVNHFCWDWGAYTLSQWMPTWLDKQMGFNIKVRGPCWR